MGRMEGKTVLVTGAARGQGRTHAVRLAEEGANIVAVDLLGDIPTNAYTLARPEDLDETVALVEKFSRRIVALQADVRDRRGLQQAVAQGVSELGNLDGVVAQAGICPLGTADPQAFVDAVSVNLGGVINAVDAALPHINDGGSVVATGSLAAFVPGATDNPEMGFGGLGYTYSKHGVASFIHDLAIVLAPRMIRANAVHPTNCNTPMLHSDIMYRQFRPDIAHPTREDAEAAFPALNAMPVPYVEPDDVAEAVLFLLSDAARFVTGLQLRVDAGAYVKARPLQAPI